MINISITKITENAHLPTHGSPFAAGYDLYTTEKITLEPGKQHAFKTGIAMAIPIGLYGRVAPRSGLAYKHGIDVLAGVIDSDYRGEIMVILINHGKESITLPIVKDGKETPIAQIIFENYTHATFSQSSELPDSVRGTTGFGASDSRTPRQQTDAKTLEELHREKINISHQKTYSQIVKEKESQ